ncbi:P-loop containing nucleoside triphosphate hydrolase protein [Mycena latifolia]|nr:P-loop containing nucleoside triphosphate hydrolase protein [Mycena latifolia]
MSKLNAAAFEFVPGRGFVVPQPAPPPPEPLERPEQTEAPRPPPTISLNIGGPKPTPPAPPPAAAAPAPCARTPGSRQLCPSTVQDLLDRKIQDRHIRHRPRGPDGRRRRGSRRSVRRWCVSCLLCWALVHSRPAVKEHLNIVFIGHVDAGKSTMGGNLLYLTGMVDKRTMEKYEREAKEAGRETWYLSWALDSTPQERLKGKTVEVGRAYFETPFRRYTILDAPGHKTFVPSMISGAAQADIAILVISARKGEFETGFEKGGQTREHIMLVKTAGVSKLIIVINKMDDPTVNWEKARYEEIRDKLIPFVRSAGFNPKTDITFIPVSAYTGVNLKDRVSKSIAPWWTGTSFLEHVDHMPMVDRKVNAPLMMPVAEKYKDMGTIVVGKVESGHMRKGDALILMPNKDAVEVAAIYNEMEEEVNQALCGDNVRIRLRGVEDEDISPGFMLTSPQKPIHAVRQFQAELAILEHKSIHMCGLLCQVTLPALLHYFDKATGRKSRKPPQFAKRGQKIVALIETTAPVCVERFADYPQLGRFTLRDEGTVTKLIEGPVDETADGVANMSINA